MPYDSDERFELDEEPENALKKPLGTTEGETQDEDKGNGGGRPRVLSSLTWPREPNPLLCYGV